ncbi:hypothetical protein K7X08_028942 [Anisodus acutangulus]|uniref:Uncharacterized protein n=1 Tax=Anisodus acutangulus TaxID=402998 RepID=A0A9Q1L157_9SOLA|nr:hypothetical protein K7X08_028942 [Anisodus acutangulus]
MKLFLRILQRLFLPVYRTIQQSIRAVKTAARQQVQGHIARLRRQLSLSSSQFYSAESPDESVLPTFLHEGLGEKQSV